MKVLFVTNIIEDFVGREVLGIFYLSAALKKAGHESQICSIADATDTVKKFKPHLLAYSITTGFHRVFLKLNSELKQSTDALSIFGGPHATFFPEVIEKPGVDIICIGEGEQVIVELCGRLDRTEDIKGIKNLWVKQNGNIYKNEVRPFIADLDSLTYPDRETFYERYEIARNNKLKSVFTARGCPFACTYCFNHSYRKIYKDKGQVVRNRSVDNVIGELHEVLRYPVDLIHFFADTFILDKDWIKDFSVKYKKEIGKPFFCLVRANLVTEDIVQDLKNAGCVSVGIGLESGNQMIRNQVMKRNISNQQIINAIALLKNAGINVLTTNMLGLPDGDLETDFGTYRLNKKCKPDYALCSIFHPYPRTELGEYCIKKGLYNISDIDEIEDMYYVKSPLAFPPEYKRQMENLQKLIAVAVAFPIPFWLLRLLIKLPPNRFFNFCYKAWKGYQGKKKIYIHRLTLKEYLKTAVRYLKSW